MRKSTTTLSGSSHTLALAPKKTAEAMVGQALDRATSPKMKVTFHQPIWIFFRWMTKVCIFHIDLTLTVAMVTENGRQYRLKYRKCLFRPHFGGFTDSVFKN